MRRPTPRLVSGFPSLNSIVAEFHYSTLTFPAAMSSKFARVALKSRADIFDLALACRFRLTLRLFSRLRGLDRETVGKNASVPDEKAIPIYHHLEPRIAAMNENTVDNRAAPRTILYSCCDPARLFTRWSAFGGLRRENQSSTVSSIPVAPSRWENWRPMWQIYASANFSMNVIAGS